MTKRDGARGAAGRAKTRLVAAHPEEYELLLDEERRKQGLPPIRSQMRRNGPLAAHTSRPNA